MSVERLTIPDVRIDQNTIRRSIIDAEKVKECAMEIYWRLKAIEDAVADEESEEYDLDRIREIMEADRDGRCVVLPCKIGTTVYSVRNQKVPDDEYRMSFHEELSVVSQVFGLHHADCIGKTVFLTREAAENALRGGD